MSVSGSRHSLDWCRTGASLARYLYVTLRMWNDSGACHPRCVTRTICITPQCANTVITDLTARDILPSIYVTCIGSSIMYQSRHHMCFLQRLSAPHHSCVLQMFGIADMIPDAALKSWLLAQKNLVGMASGTISLSPDQMAARLESTTTAGEVGALLGIAADAV